MVLERDSCKSVYEGQVFVENANEMITSFLSDNGIINWEQFTWPVLTALFFKIYFILF